MKAERIVSKTHSLYKTAICEICSKRVRARGGRERIIYCMRCDACLSRGKTRRARGEEARRSGSLENNFLSHEKNLFSLSLSPYRPLALTTQIRMAGQETQAPGLSSGSGLAEEKPEALLAHIFLHPCSLSINICTDRTILLPSSYSRFIRRSWCLAECPKGMCFYYMYLYFFPRIPLIFIRRVFPVADFTRISSGYIELLCMFYSRSPPFFETF